MLTIEADPGGGLITTPSVRTLITALIYDLLIIIKRSADKLVKCSYYELRIIKWIMYMFRHVGWKETRPLFSATDI